MESKTKQPSLETPIVFSSNLLQKQETFQHAFFSKIGGTSSGEFASLNMCSKRGDDSKNVSQNRLIAAQHFGHQNSCNLVTVHQIHSADIIIVEEPFEKDEQPQADGLITSQSNIILGVLTADCVPLLLAEPQTKIIGAIHAGWRGTLQGIVQKAIEKMIQLGAARSSIVAAIGPCIHQESYEVGNDVFNEFCAIDKSNEIFFRPSPKPNHFLFDLPGVVKKNLKSCGIQYIDNIQKNTYKDAQHFFSCRRAYHNNSQKFGTGLSAIMIR